MRENCCNKNSVQTSTNMNNSYAVPAMSSRTANATTLPGNLPLERPDIAFPIGELPQGNVTPEPPIGILPPGGITLPIGTLPQRPSPPTISTTLNICLNKVTYVWLRTGELFWAYPTEIKDGVVHGYRWNEKAGWFYYEYPLNNVLFVICTN